VYPSSVTRGERSILILEANDQEITDSNYHDAWASTKMALQPFWHGPHLNLMVCYNVTWERNYVMVAAVSSSLSLESKKNNIFINVTIFFITNYTCSTSILL